MTNRLLPRRSLRGLRPIVAFLALAACGCASVGPKTIPRDQFDYGGALGTSLREQLLMNIVGMRYLDAPVFINVSSVINQYTLEGEVALGAGANTGLGGQNTLSLGTAGRWSDRPTITYTPIAGQKFALSLLTPIPPESLFALVQAGWSPEMILRLAVRSINGVENEWAGPVNRRQADSRFVELLDVWKRLRDGRVIGLRREGGGPAHILVYRTQLPISDDLRRDLDFFHESLGLDPGASEYHLGYGLTPETPKEIMVLTSSLLEIMNELAWRIDVPEEHVQDARTLGSFTSEGLPPLIRVQQAAERPDDAYVAVPNRGQWFYIDDKDILSKRTFAILQLMISLTDSGDAARGPVLTIGS